MKTFVLNGKISRRKIWPWHALIYRRDSKPDEPMGTKMTYICGGTLISGNLILTAAHCLSNETGYPRHPRDFVVVLGGVTKFIEKNAKFENTIFSTVSLSVSTIFKDKYFELIEPYFFSMYSF